jgi:hypothetical protein
VHGRRLILGIVTSGVAIAALAPAAVAQPSGLQLHTRAVAERHVLASPRVIARRPGAKTLIDPKTRMFRTNVTASCRGPHGRVARAHSFRCTLAFDGRPRIAVGYVATGKYSFRIVLPVR